jgi:hypothetical protein
MATKEQVLRKLKKASRKGFTVDTNQSVMVFVRPTKETFKTLKETGYLLGDVVVKPSELHKLKGVV